MEPKPCARRTAPDNRVVQAALGAWLDSESQYRLTVEKTKEADDGSKYAQNQYEKYHTAFAAAQKVMPKGEGDPRGLRTSKVVGSHLSLSLIQLLFPPCILLEWRVRLAWRLLSRGRQSASDCAGERHHQPEQRGGGVGPARRARAHQGDHAHDRCAPAAGLCVRGGRGGGLGEGPAWARLSAVSGCPVAGRLWIIRPRPGGNGDAGPARCEPPAGSLPMRAPRYERREADSEGRGTSCPRIPQASPTGIWAQTSTAGDVYNLQGSDRSPHMPVLQVYG